MYLFYKHVFQRYTGKPTFFARKFEPIVSQEILNSVDSHLGITHTGMNYCSFVWPVTNGMWDTGISFPAATMSATVA